MDDRTIKFKKSKVILGIISFLLCYTPLFVALFVGFSYTNNVGKISLTISSERSVSILVITKNSSIGFFK